MKRSPVIGDYMTRGPHTIGVHQSISSALKIMQSHGIRHLPVYEGGQLVGLVSDRDLHLVASLMDQRPDEISVEEAMTNEPARMPADAPLGQAARLMSERKYGALVVTEGNQVAGVLTTVDALRALAELLGA